METITNIFANTYLMINVKEEEVICGTCRLRHNRCSGGSMAKKHFGRRSKTAFVNYRGEVLHHLFKFVSTESVVSDSICDIRTVSFRNLNCLHNHLDAWKDIDTSEEVLSGFNSFSEIVPSYFLSPTDYFILDLAWVSFGYMEGDIFNFITVFVVNAYQNVMAILKNSVSWRMMILRIV
jgi:hypothetical protein